MAKAKKAEQTSLIDFDLKQGDVLKKGTFKGYNKEKIAAMNSDQRGELERQIKASKKKNQMRGLEARSEYDRKAREEDPF